MEQSNSREPQVAPTVSPVASPPTSANPQASESNRRDVVVRSDAEPQRIRFARGRTRAVIRDVVEVGDEKEYVISARAGQMMTVRITSTKKDDDRQNDPAFWVFTEPAAEILNVDSFNWSGKLPQTGDYIINVGAGRERAEYVLEVTIR